MGEIISELGKLGIKSIMFGGEGEPFLNDDLGKMVVAAFYNDIDVAITTNGVLFTNPYHYLGITKWIKVSVDAGSAKTYAKIHRTSGDDFHSVFKNLEYAVEIKHKEKYECTLGVQSLLLNENKDELINLAKLSQNIGIDYLVIKPYSQHLSSKNKLSVNLEQIKELAYKLSEFNTNNFKVIFRLNAFNRTKKNYQDCFSLPFWAYISTVGDVWNCSAMIGNNDIFNLGNIYHHTFKEIWENHFNSADIEGCRINCRMDACNEYLWELKHPSGHVNFI